MESLFVPRRVGILDEAPTGSVAARARSRGGWVTSPSPERGLEFRKRFLPVRIERPRRAGKARDVCGTGSAADA
ncbi:hypothetical protein GCM10020227_02640 [Streptomyces flavovirens]